MPVNEVVLPVTQWLAIFHQAVNNAHPLVDRLPFHANEGARLDAALNRAGEGASQLLRGQFSSPG
jgi:hypothetical protein